jgi:ABC-type ATPase involved in cell division
MDEPTSALDLESSNNLIESLMNLRDHGCAILVTSHDQNLVKRLGGTSWRMEAGDLRMS